MTGMIAPPQQAPQPGADVLSATKSDNEPTTTPPPLDNLPQMGNYEEAALVGKVRELFLRARDRKRPLVAQWNRNYKILNTAVNSSALPVDSWRPNPKVPEIWPVLDSIVSWVTDQSPKFSAVPVVDPLNPWYGQLTDMADDLITTIRASWHVDRNDAEIEKVVWDAMTYRIGYLKTVWDGSAYRGYGNGVMKRVDPYTIYPDPEASSMETLNYIIEARTISLQEMERRWPGSIARTKDGAWTDDVDQSLNALDQNTSSRPMANPGAIAPATTPRYGLPGQSGRVGVSDAEGVTIFEAWLRTPKHADDGKVYDSWRCVVIAGNRVLMDRMAEELWSHGQHPYDRFVTQETGEFYGASMVEMLTPMQRSINRILSSIENNIDLTGNPVLIENVRSGLSRTAMTNKPGTRHQINDGGDLHFMEPPQPATNMATEMVKFYIQEMERISGLSAVVRGASPSGRNAQGVIDAMQESAFVRIRKTLRNLSLTIGASGEKLASLIVEFYSEPRMISLVSGDGETAVKHLRANHFYLPTSDGPVPMRFQLLIGGGENTSMSRDARNAELDTLFAMGAIDAEAVLELRGFPGWRKIVQRQRELQAQQGTLGQPPTQRAAARR